jgi:hypothetical protein
MSAARRGHSRPHHRPARSVGFYEIELPDHLAAIVHRWAARWGISPDRALGRIILEQAKALGFDPNKPAGGAPA